MTGIEFESVLHRSFFMLVWVLFTVTVVNARSAVKDQRWGEGHEFHGWPITDLCMIRCGHLCYQLRYIRSTS